MGKGKKGKGTNNDLQNIHKTEDQVTRTTLKTGSKLRCSGRVSSSCSTPGILCVTLVKLPVVSHEWGNDREVLTKKRSISMVICDRDILNS
jgi:hypothetical protein